MGERMNTPKTDAAIARLPEGAALPMSLTPPVFAADFVVQAREALDRGDMAQAAILTGKGLDAFTRRPPARHAALWREALDELVMLTGATPSPSVRIIDVR